MRDKNNVQIRTGDDVIISGGYFKSDNGTFRVLASPGDKGWVDNSYYMYRVLKNGKMSNARGKMQAWPLQVSTKNQKDMARAMEHNYNNATIEVVKREYWILPKDSYGQPDGNVESKIMSRADYVEARENHVYIFDSYVKALIRAQD